MASHFREQENYVRIIELTPALRRRIEAVIDHLVSLIDAYDGSDYRSSSGWSLDIERRGNHERECKDHE